MAYAESDVLEGRDVAVEYRWAENQLDRLPALAADLVRRGASVIAAGGGSTQAAKNAAPTTPIVFLTVEGPGEARLGGELEPPGRSDDRDLPICLGP